MSISDIQNALAAQGYKPGPVDGSLGPMTRAAIKAYQAANGLAVDGVAGPKTQAALFGWQAPRKASVTADGAIPWLAVAKSLIGLREGAGAANNPTLLKWGKDLNLAYGVDEIPWCGLFVGHCMSAALPDEPLPANLLGARNWLKFGRDVPPQLGAVMVFWRGTKAGWSGHVALHVGEDATTYHILGGNQSDSVSVTKILKDRFLGARWPISVAAPNLKGATDSRGLQLSTNEA